jgi:hypothetical protein
MSIVGARRLVLPPEAHMKEGIQRKDAGRRAHSRCGERAIDSLCWLTKFSMPSLTGQVHGGCIMQEAPR